MSKRITLCWPLCWLFSVVMVISNSQENAIPLIDLENASEQEVAQQIRRACEEIGFFAIVNLGVNETTIQRAWDSSRDFFDLPIKEKQRSVSENNMEYPYGYEQSESLTRGKARDGGGDGGGEHESFPDLKETFAIGPSHSKSGMPPRRFPEQPVEFKSAVEDYYSVMEDLALRLLRLFSIALELPPDWFQDKMDRHQSALRLLNYPNLDDTVEPAPGQLRAGAHTDYGALTILKSGGPGLQVLRNEGKWVDVPYLKDVFVINVGDLMQRWTNGTYSRNHTDARLKPSCLIVGVSPCNFRQVGIDHASSSSTTT